MRFVLRSVALAALALFLLLHFSASPHPTHAAFTDTDGDGAVDVVEEVLGSNPGDSSSTPETMDYLFRSFATSCDDGLDNDGDGAVDAADAGCTDSDGSFPSDQTELILGSDPGNDESYPEDSRLDSALSAEGYLFFGATCLDEQDDDGDGLIDADDPGCAPVDSDADGFEDFVEKSLGANWEDADSVPEHLSVNPGSCNDASDNDGDSLIDSADEGCVTAANDDFADAVAVDTLPFAHTAKIAGATAEPGEPAASCIYYNGDGAQRSTVWYRFTAPADTHVVIDTGRSDLVAAISVWSEDTSGLTEVDCSVTYPYFLNTSRFSFAATAGETYFIQLDRYVLDPADLPGLIDLGRLSVHMEEALVPDNDDFADAQPIPSLPFEVSADTVAASVEPGEPDASCRYQGYPTSSVWYRYTPAADTYVLASVQPGTDFGVTVGVYEGTYVSALVQVACGSELAFQARAGRTYYLQAAGYRCSSPAAGDGEVASVCFDNRAGQLDLRVQTFELPTCPPAQFTFTDPVGDPKEHWGVPVPIDITSMSVAFGGAYACVTVGVGSPLLSTPLWARIQIDADLDRSTGSHGYDYDGCGPAGLGVDLDPWYSGLDEGLLLSRSTLDGYVTHTESAFTFILPVANIGGDPSLRFSVLVHNRLGRNSGHFADCAPNGGNITCEDGVCAFAPFRNGDANCSGPADAIDAAIVLQLSAGFVASVACPDAADVNGDGLIDSRDAALILQFSAGLVGALP